MEEVWNSPHSRTCNERWQQHIKQERKCMYNVFIQTVLFHFTQRQPFYCDNKKTHFGLPVKCLTFFPVLTKFVFSQQTFIVVPNIKDYRNLTNGIHTPDVWTDGQRGRQMDKHKKVNSPSL